MHHRISGTQKSWFGLAILVSLGMLPVISCLNVQSSNKRHKVESDKEKSSLTEADGKASEPIMIGGAFLVCAKSIPQADTPGSTISLTGCRIEDESRSKIQLTDLSAEDLQVIDSNTGLTVNNTVFLPQADDSFWHWSTVAQILPEYRIRLVRDFGFPVEPSTVDVLDEYPEELEAAVNYECGGLPFGGACFYLSNPGDFCMNTCITRGGLALLEFDLYDAANCREVLDSLAVDPFIGQEPQVLPLTLQTCGFSPTALTEALPAGRYLAAIPDDDGPDDDDETILEPFLQVCGCRN